jgi:hypothetical protein
LRFFSLQFLLVFVTETRFLSFTLWTFISFYLLSLCRILSFRFCLSCRSQFQFQLIFPLMKRFQFLNKLLGSVIRFLRFRTGSCDSLPWLRVLIVIFRQTFFFHGTSW